MIEVSFCNAADNALIKYAVVAAKSGGKWVLCKHRERITFEFPGGHRETGEEIDAAAQRELYEETGAVEYQMSRIGPYSVREFDETGQMLQETFAMLYFAEISRFGELPADFEMERIQLSDELPENWTYADIQPFLLKRVDEFLSQ